VKYILEGPKSSHSAISLHVNTALNYILAQNVQTEDSKTRLCERLRCTKLYHAN